ncbi:cytochrome c oxidase subunit 4 [Streptomyces sp. N2A]|uniref:aa3-type cytochrome oxidase subunit IV n=1 Tax=Streptomyces sp. N2A TaxID=3073936 RepID=UPI0028707C86|nr:cytochrome c oxidase subunit 4 [Streptomyces sp. N2A]
MKRGPYSFLAAAVWRRKYSVLVAIGYAVAALGVVHGLWVFLVGLGILGGGAFGFTFQYQEGEE